MKDTDAFWAGPFGDEYTQRNQVDWRARLPFWRRVLALTNPNFAFEVGANAGWNLRAIYDESPGTMLAGIEINAEACKAAGKTGLGLGVIHSSLDAYLPRHHPWQPDLVFTAGVLIHIAPSDIDAAMLKIRDMSTRWVLAVEYSAEQETEVEYRGHAGRLWKREIGEMYQALGLKQRACIERPEGFDNCTAWLMEKA